MVHVIGLQFLGFFVSVVFDKIYVAPSDSNFGAFSGISTTSGSNDASIECRFDRASRQKLQIFSIPGDFYLWEFFSAASIFSLLIFFPILFLFIVVHFSLVLFPLWSFVESFFFTLYLFPQLLHVFSGGCFIYNYHFLHFLSIKLLFFFFEKYVLAVKFSPFVMPL